MRRKLLTPRFIGLGVIVFLILAALPVLAVSQLEERDTFCISCHTTPEVTYYNRAQMGLAGEEPYLDLSSAHYALVAQNPDEEPFHCIDCHRGDDGLIHRATALALGARDGLIYLTGQADPAIEKIELEVPGLLTGACVKCHVESLLEAGFNNHFHNKLPETRQALMEGAELTIPSDFPENAPREVKTSETTVLCVDCHRAHIHTEGSELQAYLDVVNIVYPACEQCHEEEGHGPLELAP